MSFDKIDSLLNKLIIDNIIPAISIAIGQNGAIVFTKSYGKIKETNTLVNNKTRFDIASLTKVITGICFMKLVEAGKIHLNDCISDIFCKMNHVLAIEKNGQVVGYVDAGKITWYQALTHTTGMGWARPKTRPSLPNLDKGFEDIYNLPFVSKPGKHIIYTDIPIILMGKAMEYISGVKLDQFILDHVCRPLKLTNTSYLRISSGPYDCLNIAPTEYDSVFRKQRVWGFVHDENAYLLDGVAGHAGIFSTAVDMCKLAMNYNSCIYTNGLLSRSSVNDMIAQHVEENGERRGLLWLLNSTKQNTYTKYLSTKAYGHSGFTGCFLWNDPVKDLSIVLLTNDVYNGRDNRKLCIFREQIMGAIASSLDDNLL